MKRILTAIVGIPILLYTVWSESPYFFVGLTTIAILLAMSEFYGLASAIGSKPNSILGYAGGIAVIASFVLERPWIAVAALIALTIAILIAAVFRPDDLKQSLGSVASTVFGVIYVAMLAGCLTAVRMIPDAPRSGTPHIAAKLLTMFFAMVMMTDTGAYYTGRTIGRHKLAPKVSPGKTIEGAVGGFLTAVLTAYLFKVILFVEIPVTHALALGAVIGAIGQVGDLAESMLKRAAGVKDSGTLLPGHGGMLDRVDSILFCAPVLYYYARLFASSL